MKSPVPLRRFAGGCVIALLLATGCGKDSDSPTGPGNNPQTTTMAGVMINGSENGALTVTIGTTTLAPPPGANRATGLAVDASAVYRRIGGPNVTMTGTYDADTDSIALAGDGYSVTTMVETDNVPPSMVGQYDGPNGIGLFGAVQHSGGSNPPVACGTYQSGTTAENGNMGVLITGADAAGVLFSAQSVAFYPFEGMVTGGGTTLTLTGQGGEGSDSLSIAGTYNTLNGQMSGTWMLFDTGAMSMVDQGTWTAGPCP